jgi:hypothetical protein
MNKNIIAAVAVGALTMAGCQNVTDQLGNKMLEGVINSSTNGEVKVNLDSLKDGKIDIQTKDGNISLDGTENGGSLKMTDSSGNTVLDANGTDGSFTVKDDKGNVVMEGDKDSVVMTGDDGQKVTMTGGSGEARPANAPADLPSLEGAKSFGLFTVGDMTSMTFETGSTDLKGVCEKQTALVEGAGWKKSEQGFNIETSDTIVKNYEKDGMSLMMSCGNPTGTPGGEITVGLQKGKLAS